jgi:glutaredoxin
MQITIYTTKGCPDCYGLKQWLNYKNIPYTEIDIKEPGISGYLKNKYGVRVAPITVIGDKFFYGTFDIQKSQIEAVLKKEVK